MTHSLSYDRPLEEHQSFSIPFNWRLVGALLLNTMVWVGLAFIVMRLLD